MKRETGRKNGTMNKRCGWNTSNGNNIREIPMANGYMRTTFINIAQRNTNWKSFLHSKTFVKFPIMSARSSRSSDQAAAAIAVAGTSAVIVATTFTSSHRRKTLSNWCNFCFIVLRFISYRMPSLRKSFWSYQIDLTNEHQVNDSNV